MIIGITGTAGAGKDTLARYLSGAGFFHISLSDIIREEARRRGLSLSRRNLQDLGNQMRRRYGLGIFSEKALAKIKKGKNYAITSIRNPGEVVPLARRREFVLLAVDAPQEQRFCRVAGRGRENGEEDVFEAFKKSEAREIASPDASSQQLAECMKMAQFKIINDTDLGSFFGKVDAVMARIAADSKI